MKYLAYLQGVPAGGPTIDSVIELERPLTSLNVPTLETPVRIVGPGQLPRIERTTVYRFDLVGHDEQARVLYYRLAGVVR